MFLFGAGGVLFKVYIVGDAIKVVRRFSLPDISNWELSNDAGLYNFPRVSCAAASADDADLDPNVAGNSSNLECLLDQMLSVHLRFLKVQWTFTLREKKPLKKTMPSLTHLI